MNQTSPARLPAVIALAATALVLMVVGLERTPFRGYHGDVDHALIARGIADGENALTPRALDGAPLAVPPLSHWLAAGLYDVTGRRDEMPARLVSVMAALFLVLATAHLGWRSRDLATGLRAGLLLATTYLLLLMARQPLPEVVMLAGFGAALIAFAELLTGPPHQRRWWWLLLSSAVGWSVMAAGVAALPVLALIFGPTMVRRPELRPGRGATVLMAATVILLVLPWALVAARSGDGAWRAVLAPFQGPPEPWTREAWSYYAVDLVYHSLPWLPLWLGGLVWAARRWRRDALSGALTWWAAGGLIFFTLAAASKRSHDLLTLYPAFALLAADLWRVHTERERDARFPRRIFAVVRALTDVTVGLAAAALTAAVLQGWLAWPWLALLGLVVGGGWRLDPSRRGVVPGFDTQIAMVAVVLLAYHGSVVPRLYTFLSGAPFYREAREIVANGEPGPVLVSDVPPALTAFYMDVPVRPVPLPRLAERVDEVARGWLVAPPDVAARLEGLSPAIERTWTSPFTRETRSRGLYRIGPSTEAFRGDPPMVPSAAHQEVQR